MIRLIANKLAPHLKKDPRPDLVAEALGMDQPGWPADPKTHLGMAQELLRTDPEAFAVLMHYVDQLDLGGVPSREPHCLIRYVGPGKCLRPEISM